MKTKLIVGSSALLAALSLGSCGSQAYRDTRAGTFHGNLDVRWSKNDLFIFVPDRAKPFSFTRADGKTITPGPMYTDGGSIPRFLWGVSGLSPWGYAPAYIVHDWLFTAKHCNTAPDNGYAFPETAQVLAEGLKAIMENDSAVKDDFVFTSVVTAVSSSIARKRWEQGECKPVLVDMAGLQEPQGELIMTISFSPKQ